MGAINYKTSDYITIGYNCNNIDYEDEFSHEYITDYYEQVKHQLNKQYFNYFHITLKPGYYEGFHLDIEFNYKAFFDGWEDRRAAQKEVTQIKAFLIECVNDFECCAVSPGWCTTFYDYKTTLQKIDEAITEMRNDIKLTPTYRQYNKGA